MRSVPDTARAPFLPGGDPLEEKGATVGWVALALLLLHALLAWLVRTPSFTTINDHSVYVFLARSLLDGGYHEVWRVDAPIHAQYPPLFPAFLAALFVVAGERLDLIHAAVIGWSVLALGILFVTLRRVWGPTFALLSLAVCAVNPSLLERAGEVMAEPMFIAWITLALWAVTQAEQTRRTMVIAGAAAIAATLTRSAGMPVAMAIGLWFLLQRRHRATLAFAVASAVSTGGWIAWTVFAPQKLVGRSYVADAVYAGEGVTQAPSIAVVLAQRILDHIPRYLIHSLPWQLPLPAIPGTPVDNAVALLLVVAGLGVGAVVLWRRWRPALMVGLAYGAMLAVWPWVVGRFVEPILPLLVATFIAGFTAAGAWRWGRRGALGGLFASAALLFVTAVQRDATFIGRTLRCDRAAPLRSADCFGEEERSFFATMELVNRAAAPDAPILVAKDSPFAMLSGRKVLIALDAIAQDTASFFPFLESQRVRWIVLTHISFLDDPLSERLLTVCRRLRLEATVPPLSSVYTWVGVDSAATDDNAPACVELARYRRTATRLD